jgi:hypothetical protein
LTPRANRRKQDRGDHGMTKRANDNPDNPPDTAQMSLGGIVSSCPL